LPSPPPFAHAGIAPSSLPTMLINWLGCQLKHTKIILCAGSKKNKKTKKKTGLVLALENTSCKYQG
jgi:hypothetical protein